jgi:DNA repair protein RadD
MKLRSYQSDASRSIWTYLQKEKGKNPLVAMATGSGKSLVIADICKTAIQQYQGRCLVLAHRKELLEQNASKIQALLPDLDVGIYSAGLGRKDIDQEIICAGIQSVYKSAHLLGRRHLIIVDECHLIPKDGDGMYRQFLADMAEINGKVRVIGLTATPYRTGEGHLCDGDGIFDKVVYETDIVQLIADGYLSPIVNRASTTKYDTSGLHIRGGEFIESELQALFTDYGKIKAATDEILANTQDRKSCILFCSGVNHAAMVAEIIGGEVITGETPSKERQEIIEQFRAGEIKYLCNCDVLTTGFDATGIDAVIVLRSTMSAGLFVQMVGRGMRLHEGKTDCLLLDFGQNLFRHGPINAIDYGQAKKMREAGDPPTKTCPNCKEQVFASARVCWCGHEFPERELKHDVVADDKSDVIASAKESIVNDWFFQRHRKVGSPDSLKVTYLLGGNLDRVSEWVCFLHGGFATEKARRWWQEHCNDTLKNVLDLYLDEHGDGDIIDAIMQWKNNGFVARPSSLTVVKSGKYDRIVKRKVIKADAIPF